MYREGGSKRGASGGTVFSFLTWVVDMQVLTL